MPLTTRTPTGKPSWPVLALVGPEKTGKSWAAAAVSGSTHLDSTLWLSVGEQDPDEYSEVPGARFEIVEHDGTYRSILQACKDMVDEAKRRKAKSGKPVLLVVDSTGRIWNLLTDMAQLEANKRRKQDSLAEAKIDTDIWNVATTRWYNILNTLKDNDGPVILTARMEVKLLFGDDGQIVVDERKRPMRADTIEAQKRFGADVSAIIKLHEPGVAELTGARSVKLAALGIRTHTWTGNEFKVEKVWEQMGLLEDGAVGERHETKHQAEDPLPDMRDAELSRIRRIVGDDRNVIRDIADSWEKRYGHPIAQTELLPELVEYRKSLQQRADARAEQEKAAQEQPADGDHRQTERDMEAAQR